jgi:hypothetical protein
MTIAEKIFEEVRTLPETQAQAVLDFVSVLKTKQQSNRVTARKTALEQLARYRGRFKANKFSRDQIYDRACLR